MSHDDRRRAASSPGQSTMSRSCARCACRGELLARLGASLDWRARDVQRLWEALKLPDEQLVAALGGSRRAELSAWLQSASGRQAATAHDERLEQDPAAVNPAPPPAHPRPPVGVQRGAQRICRHVGAYPSRLQGAPLAPHELYVKGDVGQLQELLAEPVVAIVGNARCSDYGLELARALGRQLGAAGVSVIAQLAGGISYGALSGALQGGGRALGVVAGGVDGCSPRCCLDVYHGLERSGCLLSELPCGSAPRRWTQLGCARTIALMADLVVVVEAGEHTPEMACAELARALGKKLGAMPGRVTSPLARCSHRLIKHGAELVCDARDALALLYGVPLDAVDVPAAKLEPRLQATLAQIGEGLDTVAKLSTRRGGTGTVMLDLAELELRGLLVRGDGGRYVPCAVAPAE